MTAKHFNVERFLRDSSESSREKVRDGWSPLAHTPMNQLIAAF